MELAKRLGIKRGTIITIVGAGGKTSLMFTLAKELKEQYKILVTTTTKILVPNCDQYDFLATDTTLYDSLKEQNQLGIYVYGHMIENESKLSDGNLNYKDSLQYFDIILIEGDGSKGKPIKGWKETEPVVPKETTITIGVLSIEVIGQLITDETIHRIDEFMNLTHTKLNERITSDDLISLIYHPKGLFKNAVGKKVLLINKIESKEALQLANELYTKVMEVQPCIEQIIMGSLKEHTLITGGESFA